VSSRRGLLQKKLIDPKLIVDVAKHCVIKPQHLDPKWRAKERKREDARLQHLRDLAAGRDPHVKDKEKEKELSQWQKEQLEQMKKQMADKKDKKPNEEDKRGSLTKRTESTANLIDEMMKEQAEEEAKEKEALAAANTAIARNSQMLEKLDEKKRQSLLSENPGSKKKRKSEDDILETVNAHLNAVSSIPKPDFLAAPVRKNYKDTYLWSEYSRKKPKLEKQIRKWALQSMGQPTNVYNDHLSEWRRLMGPNYDDYGNPTDGSMPGGGASASTDHTGAKGATEDTNKRQTFTGAADVLGWDTEAQGGGDQGTKGKSEKKKEKPVGVGISSGPPVMLQTHLKKPDNYVKLPAKESWDHHHIEAIERLRSPRGPYPHKMRQQLEELIDDAKFSGFDLDDPTLGARSISPLINEIIDRKGPRHLAPDGYPKETQIKSQFKHRPAIISGGGNFRMVDVKTRIHKGIYGRQVGGPGSSDGPPGFGDTPAYHGASRDAGFGDTFEHPEVAVGEVKGAVGGKEETKKERKRREKTSK